MTRIDMKRTSFCCALLAASGVLFLCSVVFPQAEPAAVDALKRENAELIAKYSAGKYTEAIKAGERALAMSISIFGAESAETAVVHNNLGDVYSAKKDYERSVLNLRAAYDIYRTKPGVYQLQLNKILPKLATALTLDGKQAEAEDMFVRNVTRHEKPGSPPSKDLLIALKLLTDFYAYTRQYDKADEVFLLCYSFYSNITDQNREESEVLSGDRMCYEVQNFGMQERGKREKKFREAVKSLELDSGTTDEVLNGKALVLPKPSYPMEARSRRAQGAVVVRIWVDEAGRVVTAKGLCGDTLLYGASEEAARNARFSPTLVGGKPTKVSGFIAYNFAVNCSPNDV